MPSVSEIMDMSRLLCNKSATMSWLSNADLLPYLNVLVYAKVQETIRKRVDSEYFSYEYTTNIVATQDKYLLPQATNTTPWALKIIKLAIKEASTDDYYEVIKQDWAKWKEKYTDYEAVNANPKYYDVRWGYVYLYPTPTANVTDWMKMLASVTLPDLETTSLEDDIFPNHQQLRVYHNVLVSWLKSVIYAITGDTELKIEASNDFERDLDNMVLSMQKWQEVVYWETFIWNEYW